MKKIILVIGVFFLALFISNSVFAQSSSDDTSSALSDPFPSSDAATIGFFGGTITETTDIQIQALEDASYVCAVPGTTIDITPVGGSPVGYLIPASTTPQTQTTPDLDEYILGIYTTTPTTITCTEPATGATETVELNSINYFGTAEMPGTPNV